MDKNSTPCILICILFSKIKIEIQISIDKFYAHEFHRHKTTKRILGEVSIRE